MSEVTQPAGAGEGGAAIADTSAPVATSPTNDQPATDQPKAESIDYAAENKKLQNALARKERRIGQLTAQKYQYQNDLDSHRKQLETYQAPKEAKSGRPDPEVYKSQGKTWDAYLEDLADWKVSEGLTKAQQKNAEAQKTNEKTAWREERGQALSDDAAAARESFSDFQNVIQEHADVLQSLPEHIHDAFLECDTPAHAFYALIKEGTLEQVLQAKTATRAAALIAKAEDRAQALKVKPVTKTPAPMTPSKGTAPGTKTLNRMSPSELVAWAKS